MAGLGPAISYPHQVANDEIPVSNHPMEIAVQPNHDGIGTLRAVRQQLGPLVSVLESARDFEHNQRRGQIAQLVSGSRPFAIVLTAGTCAISVIRG
jgi:hypothetical protein